MIRKKDLDSRILKLARRITELEDREGDREGRNQDVKKDIKSRIHKVKLMLSSLEDQCGMAKSKIDSDKVFTSAQVLQTSVEYLDMSVDNLL